MYVSSSGRPRNTPRIVVRRRNRGLGDVIDPTNPTTIAICANPTMLPLCAAAYGVSQVDWLNLSNDAVNVSAGRAAPSQVSASIAACQKNAQDNFDKGGISAQQLAQIQLACFNEGNAASKQTPDVPSPVLDTLIPFLLIGGVLATGVVIATH